METLINLVLVCAALLLVGGVYAGVSEYVIRRHSKPEDEIVTDTFPWPSHRP